MGRNQINFSKMTAEALAQVETFKKSATDIAIEDLRYKKEIKPLNAQRDAILQTREDYIKNGLSLDEAITKHSTLEVDKAIHKAENEHKEIIAPLQKAMKDTYVFIPDTMHDAYTKKINEGKRGEFLNAIKEFLGNLGLECSQGQINKFAESMSDKFGSKYATSKKIVEDSTFTTAIKKNQFNKLFMAVFCDVVMK